MRYMLDTNICIYLIKNKPREVLKRMLAHKPEEICISAVTYAELTYGAYKSKAVDRNRAALVLLLANIDILEFDSFAADKYGEIRANLEKAGTPIGPMDTMIAAHTLSLGYTVVTNNVREFARVEGLNVENWAQ